MWTGAPEVRVLLAEREALPTLGKERDGHAQCHREFRERCTARPEHLDSNWPIAAGVTPTSVANSPLRRPRNCRACVSRSPSNRSRAVSMFAETSAPSPRRRPPRRGAESSSSSSTGSGRPGTGAVRVLGHGAQRLQIATTSRQPVTLRRRLDRRREVDRDELPSIGFPRCAMIQFVAIPSGRRRPRRRALSGSRSPWPPRLAIREGRARGSLHRRRLARPCSIGRGCHRCAARVRGRATLRRPRATPRRRA